MNSKALFVLSVITVSHADSSSFTVHNRSKRAAATHGDDYYYSNPDEEVPQPYEIFTSIIYLSAVVIGLQMVVTIFSPKMKDLPIRWHTLNYCCWNVFQLLIFSNCSEASRFKDYLENSWISENCENVQIMTLSVFFCSMILQVPVMTFLHFFPKLENSKFYKFYVWIPIYFFLDLGIFLTYASYRWKWVPDDDQYVIPYSVFQAGITVLNLLVEIILLFVTFGAIFHFIIYCIRHCGRSEGQITTKFMNLLNFFFFLVYTVTINALHTPTNNLTMSKFLMPYVREFLKPYEDILLEITARLLIVNQPFILCIPVWEFIATMLFIPMYRAQFFQCLTCGQITWELKKTTRPVMTEIDYNKVAPFVLQKAETDDYQPPVPVSVISQN